MSATALPQIQFHLLDESPRAARRAPRNDQSLRGAPARPSLVPCPSPLVPPLREDVRRLRASLEAAVASRISSGSELIRSLARQRREEVIPTTLAPFDALLGGGLPRGKMIELAGRRSTGRFSIAMAALAAATSMGEAAALVDLGDHFDPQVAEANGVDLVRLLWIRPYTLKQAVMSVEMIAATGFQLVVLDAGLHPIRGRRVPDAAWVRLARTAEAHGGAMLVSTPYPLTGTSSEALVFAESARASWLGHGQSPRLLGGTAARILLEKHRHMKSGSRTILELCVDELVDSP
ncbi:MAG TPA: hypothetical protein VEZ11_13505 [Thermoanaerobaculia bacterium]|nr:hypothetical protein [Thermoanaerobaculia bacterium]